MRTRRRLGLIWVSSILLASGPAAAGESPAQRPPKLAKEADREKLAAADAASREDALPLPALLARAEALIEQGGKRDIGQAGDILAFALTLDPDSGRAHVAAARADAIAYARRWIEEDAQIAKSLDHARRAAELLPDLPEAHAALAVARVAAEEWDEAFDEAEKAWNSRTETTAPWVTQVYAQTLIARAETSRAMEVLDAANETWPGRAPFYALKGAAFMEQSKYREAMLELRRALYLDVDFVPARLLLARALDLMGDRITAGQIYKEITVRSPEEKGRVHVLMAVTLISRGRYKEALTGLEQVELKTRRGLGEGTIVYLKAACHEELGLAEEAAREFRKVIEEYPLASYGSYAAESLATASYEALARMSIAAGKQDEAARIMEEAMQRPRPSLTLFLRLAMLYHRYGLFEDELAVLRRADAFDFGPRQAGPKVAIYVAWARALDSLHADGKAPRAEVIEALRRYAGALLATGNVSYYLEAARAAAIAGDPGAGLEWLERAAGAGYRTMDWIRSDPEMKEIAGLPGFSRLGEPER